MQKLRFLRPYWLIIIFFFNCIGPLGVKPHKQSFQQRLDSFPRNNLPLVKPAKIYWDDHLIPFIEAGTDSDCAFLLGMVHAHLRLGQMTLLRRASQ
ncbi:penicillin acylase family protein, partial [candidate division KSB1 bacterium]|nr:penicillin acylase family protein [candidate division KSB1 bacterium]